MVMHRCRGSLSAMTHPDPLALVRHACETDSPGDLTLARHLEHCATCSDEVRRLQQVCAVLRTSAADAIRTDCPDDETLAALAAGELPSGDRGEVVAHLAGCGRCRAVVGSLARAFEDPSVSKARRTAGPRPGLRLDRLAIPAAAAAVLLVAVLARPAANAPSGPAHRASDVPIAATPVPISPLGAVGRPQALRWGAVTRADRYRVTLFGAGGSMLYQLELPDTAAPLPDSVPLPAGHRYLWKVEARTGWDRWTTSDLVSFTITEGRLP
jgi:hypothetical protein